MGRLAQDERMGETLAAIPGLGGGWRLISVHPELRCGMGKGNGTVGRLSGVSGFCNWLKLLTPASFTAGPAYASIVA